MSYLISRFGTTLKILPVGSYNLHHFSTLLWSIQFE